MHPHTHKTTAKQKQIQVQLTVSPCSVRANCELFYYLLGWVFRKYGEMIEGLLSRMCTKYGTQSQNPMTTTSL